MLDPLPQIERLPELGRPIKDKIARIRFLRDRAAALRAEADQLLIECDVLTAAVQSTVRQHWSEDEMAAAQRMRSQHSPVKAA